MKVIWNRFYDEKLGGSQDQAGYLNGAYVAMSLLSSEDLTWKVTADWTKRKYR